MNRVNWITPYIAIASLLLSQSIKLHSQTQLEQVTTPQISVPRTVPRIALVIGAEHYETLPPVTNALNDAKQIARRLTQFGFDFVRYVPDPKDADEIYDYLRELAQRASNKPDQPAVIVFFFAGHGFHRGSTNYIVPVRSSIDNKNDTSVPVSSILGTLARHTNGISIFLFDSCRNIISSEDGFTSQSDPYGPAILGLAAKYGKTAMSFVQAGDVDSPYVSALTLYLDNPGYRLPQLLGLVGREVLRTTREAQAPKYIV
ncbi:caspase family protein [Tunturiibacter gelidiferens]|uniref:caspase family protein n=1 Tax=Tunturiibacter gelidiferens TaxID=3069689 RepID=UPI003D9ABD87